MIDEDDREGEALRSLVSLPWITQQHFVGMLQARRIDQVDREVLQSEIRMPIFVKPGLRPHESCDGPANSRVVLQIEN